MILGLDFGDARMGIAKSDPFGWTAQPVETFQTQGGIDRPADRAAELVKAYGIKSIVVGYPVNMNGTRGPRVERTDLFIEALQRRLGEDFPIVRWDERLSTKAAWSTMHDLGVKTKKKKGLVDQIAAVHILQTYLDSRQG